MSSTANTLILYFSKSGENFYVGDVKIGNTGRMARLIQKNLKEKGDLVEIEPVDPYPYTTSETATRSKKEKTSNARPAIKSPVFKDLKNYSTIFFGYPVWEADMPMIMYTFIETYKEELSQGNKTIIPFCTHEGIDFIQSYKNFRRALPNVNMLRGFGLYGKYVDTSESKVKNWLKKINY